MAEGRPVTMDDDRLMALVNNSSWPSVAEDLAQLAPYLEGDYMAQLGLELLPAERIIALLPSYKEYGFGLTSAGWYGPRDITTEEPHPSDLEKRDFTLKDLKRQGKDPSVILDKEGRALEYVTYRGEDRADRLSTLAHELRHVGDEYLSRQLGVDDDPEMQETLGEGYTRLADIHHREDRGFGSPPTELGKQIESEAVREGIPARYKGDPFGESVLRRGERMSPEYFEDKVMRHPAQDAAKRELERLRLAKSKMGVLAGSDEEHLYNQELNSQIRAFQTAMAEGPETQQKFTREMSVDPTYTQEFRDAVLQSADVGPPSFAGGGIANLVAKRVPNPGTRAAYPPLVPSLVPEGSGTIRLGGFEEHQFPAGGSTRNFSIRTPPQGVPLGAFRLPSGEHVRGQLTGDYGRSTSKITPQAMGISPQLIEQLRLRNQERERTSYNVGIAAFLPGGMLPGFMDRVLRPKSVDVTYGESSQEIQDVTGQQFDQSDRRRGIGLTAEVLQGIFGKNAPTAGYRYHETNGSAKEHAASLDIRRGGGVFSLSGRKSPGETSFGVRGRFPL